MNKYTTIVLLLIFAISCQNKYSHTKQIPLKLDTSEKEKFSDIFSEINYLLLDMGDSKILARPYHILFGADRIIVEDRDLSNIHIFDLAGKRLSSIKSDYSGGPGTIKQSEYLQLMDDKVLIYDIPLSKTVVFDLEGNFLEEKKEPFFFDAFYHLKENRLLFNGIKDLKQGKVFINQKKNSSDDTTLLYRFPNDYYWMSVGTKDGFMADPSSDNVYFNIPYSYEIVEFDRKGDIYQSFEFDLGSKGLPHDKRFRLAENRELNRHLAENRMINDIHSFFPMRNHFFMYLYQHDPNGKPTHHFLVFDRGMNLLYQCIDPKNDLDGMTLGGVPWTYHDDKVYIIVNSTTFYNQYIQKFSGQNVEIKPGNVHEFFQKNQEKLKDDQTVLVSLELKENIKSSN